MPEMRLSTLILAARGSISRAKMRGERASLVPFEIPKGFARVPSVNTLAEGDSVYRVLQIETSL